jgi:hypothetical protein
LPYQYIKTDFQKKSEKKFNDGFMAGKDVVHFHQWYKQLMIA